MDINYHKSVLSSTTDEYTENIAEFESKKIIKDIAEIFYDTKFYDVIFTFPDGKELRAHKVILAYRSPVFKEMFLTLPSNPEGEVGNFSKEEKTSQIEITNISVEVFEQFLSYLYTGKIPSMDLFAKKMLRVAELV